VIVLRRFVAVVLAILLIVVFAVSLVASRVNATLMSPRFYERQIQAIDAFSLVHDEVLPTTVDDFLKSQNDKLPENLSAIALPTDQKSEQAILDLLRVALPPDVLQAETNAALDQVIPYLAGRTDHFDIRLHFGDQLRAVAGHAPGQPSKLQQTWDTLGLADRTIRGLVDQFASQQGAGGSGDNQNFLTAVAGDPAGANQWLETQLFGAIDQLVPYLDGDAPHFHIVISFQSYPALAAPFAEALHRTPEQLLSEGFVLDDQEINDQLAKSNRAELNQPNNALGLFRPAGYSVTEQQLLDRAAGQDGFSIPKIRTWATRFRMARWAVLGLAALLVLGIGFLGGRRWWSRLAWGAAALLVASVVTFTLASPVYSATLGHQLHDRIVEQQAKDGGNTQALRDRALDQSEIVVDNIAWRIAATSRNWAVLSVLAIAGAVGWAIYETQSSEEPALAPEPVEPPA
jgi:hypothetical protein